MLKIKDFLLELYKNWGKHDNRRSAAIITFFTLFSFVPIIMVTVSILSSVVQIGASDAEISNKISSFLGPQAASIVSNVLTNKQGLTASSILSIVILIYTSSAIFLELRYAFDKIWEYEAEDKKEGILEMLKSKLLAMGLVLSTSLVFLVTALAEFVIIFIAKYLDQIAFININLLESLDLMISFVAILFVFFFLIKILPSVAVSAKAALIGSLTSTVLFLASRFLISIYVASSSVSSFYGTAGSLIAFIIWVSIVVQIMLLGAEIARYCDK